MTIITIEHKLIVHLLKLKYGLNLSQLSISWS